MREDLLGSGYRNQNIEREDHGDARSCVCTAAIYRVSYK